MNFSAWAIRHPVPPILVFAILTLIGIVVGAGGAFWLTRLMKSMLFGVSATDPATFIAIALLLSVVALLATYIPARRATKVNPLVALRYE